MMPGDKEEIDDLRNRNIEQFPKRDEYVDARNQRNDMVDYGDLIFALDKARTAVFNARAAALDYRVNQLTATAFSTLQNILDAMQQLQGRVKQAQTEYEITANT